MDKQTQPKVSYRVVEVTVQPGQAVQKKPLKSNLSQVKAIDMRAKLEAKLGDYDPNKVVSYLIEPAR